MEGNRSPDINYAIRITFGVVHGVLLTLLSFCAAMLYPSLSHLLFSLFGFIVAPAMSLCLAIMCNLCVNYVSQSGLTVADSLKTVWIPPLGVFVVALILLPLEMIPHLFQDPLSILAISFVSVNCFLAALLQVYAAKRIQTSYSSGSSGPT